MNNYTRTTYNTKSKYKDIDSVTFYPCEKVEYKKIRNAGDRLWWKWLGLIPLIPYRVKIDKYEIGGSGYLDTRFDYPNGATLSQIINVVEHNNNAYFMDDFTIFRKAYVFISYAGKRKSEYHYFNRNEDAINFIENLKTACKKVGNDLG